MENEKIVKALEEMYILGEFRREDVEHALAYIYTLQKENLDLKVENAEQTTKIERLKQGQAESAKTAAEVLEQNIKLQKQVNELKTEIERLKDEFKTDYRNNWKNKFFGILEKNQELQKQADELKAENTELYKEHTTLIAGSILQKEQTIKDTAKDLLIDFNEWINGHHDAKLDVYSIHIPIHEVTDFLTEKAKEYGVEVE